MAGDIIGLESDTQAGEPLLLPAMRGGRRVIAPTLEEMRSGAATSLARLPEPLHRLEDSCDYPVEIAPGLRELARRLDLGLPAGT